VTRYALFSGGSSQPMLGVQHRETSGLVSAVLSVVAAVLGARMIRQLNAVQVSGPTAFPAPAA
jgi:hypothetical protein